MTDVSGSDDQDPITQRIPSTLVVAAQTRPVPPPPDMVVQDKKKFRASIDRVATEQPKLTSNAVRGLLSDKKDNRLIAGLVLQTIELDRRYTAQEREELIETIQEVLDSCQVREGSSEPPPSIPCIPPPSTPHAERTVIAAPPPSLPRDLTPAPKRRLRRTKKKSLRRRR
jgi:hypothetical protein